MGRTATTGKFKDGSFKIKLTSSDKISKYSVYFKDKKFELGKLTFNFSRETYSIPEKLVKFFNVTKTTDNTMNFLKNVDGLYDFYRRRARSRALRAGGGSLPRRRTSFRSRGWRVRRVFLREIRSADCRRSLS